jgi:S1-C subfamily serine protease
MMRTSSIKICNPSRGVRILSWAGAIWFFTCASAQADNNLIDRIQKSQRAIVTVHTELSRIMPTHPPKIATFERTAAGIVIDSCGIIVTNTHTIADAPRIFVILKDGTKLPAQVLYASRENDFSFLRIYPPHPLYRVKWADSSQVDVGDEIIAIGNSEFDGQSIMSGHIKGLLQSRSSLSNDFLVLDLVLYKGDSGGPILDDKGRLLGMIMAKKESEPNSSIAIASNKIHLRYLQYKKNMP